MPPLSRQTSGGTVLVVPGWLSVLFPLRRRAVSLLGSMYPRLPLGIGFRTTFLVLVVVLFYFILFIPSVFFSPGGKIRLCSSPALQTIHSHLHHLYSEFRWQLRYFYLSTPFQHLLCDGEEDMSPSLLLLLLPALLPSFPPQHRAPIFPDAGGHS